MEKIEFTVRYSIEELQKMILGPVYYKPVIEFDGKPVHEILSSDLLPGECFRPLEDYKVECSNYGRVKFNSEILKQYVSKEPDYLSVYIPGGEEINVWRLIAKAWCEVPPDKNEEYIVHHLTNNGFDNRPCNLLWVTRKQHSDIHCFGEKKAENKL